MKINRSIVRGRTCTTAACLATVVALTAGCGGDSTAAESGSAATAPSAATPAASPSGMAMHGMSGMMNDPSATPADKITGAKKSTFALLDSRPPGTDTVKGTAWLAQNDKGTTLTVALTGLTAGADYVGHLHASACAADNGGEHFKFDPNGGDTPPNEVHIGFTADAGGMGMATVTNHRKVEDAAKAVVIHPADATDNRLACADF